MLKTFTIIIHKDEDVGAYWAECPILPGCIAQADTIEEVKKFMKDAIKIYLEDCSPIENVIEDCVTLEVANA